MKTFSSMIMAIMLSLMLAACGGANAPVLDTTSEAALEASIEAIMDSLDDEEQEAFQEAIVGIAMLIGFANLGESQADIENAVREALHGKGAQEIFEMAEEIADRLDADF